MILSNVAELVQAQREVMSFKQQSKELERVPEEEERKDELEELGEVTFRPLDLFESEFTRFMRNYLSGVPAE